MGARAPVSLRPATLEDEPFMLRVYASTRADELAPVHWDTATTDAFLRMQFTAQDRAYRERHPHASFDVVLVAGEPAGRLYVDRRADAIHVIDIALTPEHRGHGIGSALLEDLLAEGRRDVRPVTLNALRSSRALGLYRRLGFAVVAEDEVYAELESRPDRPGGLRDQANIAW
jgi:ribosomal protein S18 acetylase RimI-like enzyme